MPATPSAGKKQTSTSLLAFTPRQVLLSTNQTTMNMKQSSSHTKLILHQAIARYLQRNGFSKTLKKFRSEAQIEKDNLEGSSFDLEEMCLKYLEICGKDAKLNINDQKEQVAGVSFKNKEEGKSKEKRKKKSKLVSESPASVEDNQLESQAMVTDKKGKDDVSADAKIVNGAEMEKRSKDKKKKKDKKKDKTSSQGDATEQIGNLNETVLKKDNIKASNKEGTDEEKKDSKKRKRPTSEENGEQVADKKADEEPKRRKLENLDESKGEKLAKTSVNSNSNKENAAASGQVGGDQLQKKSNGHLESAAEKSSTLKSQKKQQNESVEQKSAKKAFQRVQVDNIQFADERLQDNSYWAKDGAEIGYGAKAEEILGQVRGRDFRHEKTKKKRGTYRGGQIDLQSHSIKFNYSDED